MSTSFVPVLLRFGTPVRSTWTRSSRSRLLERPEGRVELVEEAREDRRAVVARELRLLVGPDAFQRSFNGVGIRTLFTSGLPSRETWTQRVQGRGPCFVSRTETCCRSVVIHTPIT